MWGALLKVAGGVVKADNANTELERAEAQALAMQEAKYGLEADAAAKLIPKLYITEADGKRNYAEIGGKKVNWDLGGATNAFDAVNLSNTWMEVRNSPWYENLPDSDKQSYLNIGRSMKELVELETSKVTGDYLNTRDQMHDILDQDFTVVRQEDKVVGPNIDNADLVAKNEDGTIMGVFLENKEFDKKKVTDYAIGIMSNNSGIMSSNMSKEKAARSIIQNIGPAALSFAADIPDLQLQVGSGQLNFNTINALVEKSYEYFPETDGGNSIRAQKNRDQFVENVLRAGASDYHSIKNQGFTRGNTKTEDYASTVLNINLQDKKDLYESTSQAVENTLQMINLVKDWRRDNPDAPVPAGRIGRLQGGIANFVKGGIPQLKSLIGMFSEAGGFTFDKGSKSKLEKRMTDKFLAKGKDGLTHVERVGTFRAQYEVYEEFIAYQLAAALQGGTGGRTISDQDVLNIKKAMGNSLFQDGQFLIHRLEEIGSFLQSVTDKNRLYASATSIGQLQVANIYKQYTYGVRIAQLYRDGNGSALVPVDRDNVGAQGNYRDGELSAVAVNLLDNLYINADRKANRTGLINGASLILQGKDPEGSGLDYDVGTGKVIGSVDGAKTSTDGGGDGTKTGGTLFAEGKPYTVAEGKAILADESIDDEALKAQLRTQINNLK